MPELSNTETLKKEALELFNFSKLYRKNNYEDNLRKRWKTYTRQLDDATWPLKSKIYVPHIYGNTQAMMALMINSIFSTHDLVNFMPTAQAPTENCNKVRSLINYQFEKMKSFWLFFGLFLESYIYGYSAGKVLWKNDNPVISTLDIWDFYFDYSCEWNLQTAEWVIQRKIKTLYQLQQDVKNGIYQASNEELGKLSTGAIPYKTSLFIDQNQTKLGEGISPRLQNIEVLECWIGKEVITIAGGTLVLRHIPNPFDFYPFVLLLSNPLPHDPIGEGISPSMPLQQEINNHRNLRLEMALKMLRPQWKLFGDIDEEELNWRPDGLIHLESQDSVLEQMPLQNTGGASLLEEQRMYEDVDRTSGVFPETRGDPGPSRETAFAAKLRAAAGNMRGGMFLHSCALAIEIIAGIMVEENRLFLPPQTWLNYNTGQVEMITRDEIMGSKDYRMIPICQTQPMQDIYAERLLEFYKETKGDPNINNYEFLGVLLDVNNIQEKARILQKAMPSTTLLDSKQPALAPVESAI